MRWTGEGRGWRREGVSVLLGGMILRNERRARKKQDYAPWRRLCERCHVAGISPNDRQTRYGLCGSGNLLIVRTPAVCRWFPDLPINRYLRKAYGISWYVIACDNVLALARQTLSRCFGTGPADCIKHTCRSSHLETGHFYSSPNHALEQPTDIRKWRSTSYSRSRILLINHAGK